MINLIVLILFCSFVTVLGDVDESSEGYSRYPLLRGSDEVFLGGNVLISGNESLGNGTSTSDESNGNGALYLAAYFLMVFAVTICMVASCYGCCCCRHYLNYRHRYNKGEHDDELSRTSLDDVTDSNTQVNAESRFVTPEQYIRLFKGDYHHMKSSRVTAHSARLGLHKKIPIMDNLREVTADELRESHDEDDENQGSKLNPIKPSAVPSKWVQWNNIVKVIPNTYYKDDQEPQFPQPEQLVDKSADERSDCNANGITETYPDSPQKWSRNMSNTSDQVKNKRSVTAGAAEDREAAAKRLKKIQKMYKRSLSLSTLDNRKRDQHKSNMEESESLMPKCQENEAAPNAKSRYILDKVNEDSVLSGNKSIFGNNGHRMKQEATKIPTEEPHDFVEGYSNFSNRGSGFCVPNPSRFSPVPPPVVASPRPKSLGKLSSLSTSNLGDDISIGSPSSLRSLLSRQSSLDHDEMRAKLNKAKQGRSGNRSPKKRILSSGSFKESKPLIQSTPRNHNSVASNMELASRSGSNQSCDDFDASSATLSPQNSGGRTSSRTDIPAIHTSYSPPSTLRTVPPPPPISPDNKDRMNNHLTSHKSKSDDGIKEHEKMSRGGISIGNTENKMELSGVNPARRDDHHTHSFDDKVSIPPPPSISNNSTPPPPPKNVRTEQNGTLNSLFTTNSNNDISQFVKMLKVGVPVDAVKYKMELAGVEPSLLDQHVDN